MKNLDQNKKIKFGFWGTPEIAKKNLEILKKEGLLPEIIITNPDTKQGRGMSLNSSSCAWFAQNNDISCLKPENLSEQNFIEKLKNLNLDLFIVIAYGKIIPENILSIPKFGSINVHYSLLPKYRGASPVESAILNHEKETGVTIQEMQYKMDSGPILIQEKTEILENEKTEELRERLSLIGGNLLLKIIPDILENKIKKIPQKEKEATYCQKIEKEDGLIDINQENQIDLYNKFRAYSSWPRTFFFQNNKRIIITEAILENDKFIIKKVIPEGKKEITYEVFLRNSQTNT